MDKVVGFIGSGNMGGAIICGMVSSGLLPASRIIASDISEQALAELSAKNGIRTTTSNIEVAQQADILFLAVKPHFYAGVIGEIKSYIKDDVIIVVIAAGQTHAEIEKQFGRPLKVVRTMPNTPALVCEGMTAVCPNALVGEAELGEVLSIFNSLGKTELVPETMFDAVTGVSGSCPAYVYMFIEALADATVAEGMPRAQAYRFAAQAVMGAAKMVLESGMHPGALKDMVCSPGGTTIAAVCELERTGLRSAVMSGVKACTKRSREMTV